MHTTRRSAPSRRSGIWFGAYTRLSSRTEASTTPCQPWPTAARHPQPSRWICPAAFLKRSKRPRTSSSPKPSPTSPSTPGLQRPIVTVRREQSPESQLVVEVTDDGRGGASPANGGGLSGLADRLAALDGRLFVESPQDGSTSIRAEIPLKNSSPERPLTVDQE